jgi:hypothetical protein
VVVHSSRAAPIVRPSLFHRGLPMTDHHLDGILAALNQHQQRATYSAVAALVGQTPRLLMHGRPREQSNSWIVSKTTGRPTGYSDADVHPQLTANETILTTREELTAWLANADGSTGGTLAAKEAS